MKKFNIVERNQDYSVPYRGKDLSKVLISLCHSSTRMSTVQTSILSRYKACDMEGKMH
jgi:hypothetical protein